jgi:hypothetical protein
VADGIAINPSSAETFFAKYFILRILPKTGTPWIVFPTFFLLSSKKPTTLYRREALS